MNLLANAIDAMEESNIGKTYQEIEQNPKISARIDYKKDGMTAGIFEAMSF